jgi:type IV pilus assembly protein PilW
MIDPAMTNPSDKDFRFANCGRFVQRAVLLRGQSGFSLIELMVAMAVGLIISAGAAALFANTILSTKTLNNASQIQESGNYVTQLLGRHLRMAGYVDWLSNNNNIGVMTNSADNAPLYNLEKHTVLASTTTPISMFDVAYPNQHALHGCVDGYTTPSALSTITCAAQDQGLKNSITLSYQVKSSPSEGSSATLPNDFRNQRGMNGDCNNQSTREDYAVNRFYINTANNTLMCAGSGSPKQPQPIISNVEQFVVTYGVAQTNSVSSNALTHDLSIAEYKTADQIQAANEWGNVISAKLCVLIAGEVGSLATTNGMANTTRPDCRPDGQSLIQTTDRKLRIAFTSIVALRNHLHTPSAIQQ